MEGKEPSWETEGGFLDARMDVESTTGKCCGGFVADHHRHVVWNGNASLSIWLVCSVITITHVSRSSVLRWFRLLTECFRFRRFVPASTLSDWLRTSTINSQHLQKMIRLVKSSSRWRFSEASSLHLFHWFHPSQDSADCRFMCKPFFINPFLLLLLFLLIHSETEELVKSLIQRMREKLE